MAITFWRVKGNILLLVITANRSGTKSYFVNYYSLLFSFYFFYCYYGRKIFMKI